MTLPITSASAGVGLLLGQLLLLDQAGELALGDGAGFLEGGIDELLVDVLDDDGDVGGGDRLRDLPAHGAAADDGGLGDEHWLRFPPVFGLCVRRGPREPQAIEKPAAPARRPRRSPPGLLAFLLRHEPLVGEGAGQQQQAEGDEGEGPGQLFQLGEVVGPDLGDRNRQQGQAAEAGFRRLAAPCPRRPRRARSRSRRPRARPGRSRGLRRRRCRRSRR